MIENYFSTLLRLLSATRASDAEGAGMALAEAFSRVIDEAKLATGGRNKIMFIGNGGSAGIASHVAIDYSKNGGMRALAFNDGAALTCLGNDLGYEKVFAKQIEMHGAAGDLLVAISSSGQSANILNGVRAAHDVGCTVATLSGFAPDNPLRRSGDINLYVASSEYGFVEISHLALIHAMLDFAMGWNGSV